MAMLFAGRYMTVESIVRINLQTDLFVQAMMSEEILQTENLRRVSHEASSDNQKHRKDHDQNDPGTPLWARSHMTVGASKTIGTTR